MKLDTFYGKASNLWAENRLLKFAVLCMMIMQIFMGLFVWKAMERQRTIIVPPQLNSQVEFVGNRASLEYIKEFSRYLGALAFNYTPGTARIQFDELLALFAPEAHAQYRDVFDTLAYEIETAGITNTYLVHRIAVNEEDRKIVLIGARKQYSGDTLVDSSTRTYVVKYRLENGNFRLLGLAEKDSERAMNENVDTINEDQN